MALIRRLAVNTPLHVRSLASSHQRQDNLDLSFNNYKEAYKSKKTSELFRAYFVYQVCSINWVVDNNAMLMKRMRQLVGQRIFDAIMKATFYGQFVVGENVEKMQPAIKRLRTFGIRPIIGYAVEEDLTKENEDNGEINRYKDNQLNQFSDGSPKSSSKSKFYMNEAICEKNMATFVRSVEAAAAGVTDGTGLMAIKVTAIGRPQMLLEISKLLMRARKYLQQIASGTGDMLNHSRTIEDLQRYLEERSSNPEVQKIIEKINSNKRNVVNLFPWSNIFDENMNVSNSFRLPDPQTGQMRRFISQIRPEEELMFRNLLRRLNQIIKVAEEMNVRVLIDSEQTYFQPVISRISMELMNRYNKDKLLVYRTYQTYLRYTYNEIVTDMEQAQRQNFYWGAKLVRGAYIEQERARAKALGYNEPTCANIEATTASYHKCLEKILTRVKDKFLFGIMVASHNEDTVRFAVQLMKDLDIKPNDATVKFGQLLGMSDHITFPLGQAGYAAYKYVPYGEITDVLPYLSRRTNENRGFLKKVTKEKSLILKEILRRVFTGQMFYKPVGEYSPA